MTPKTLRQERIEKVFEILESAYQDNPKKEEASIYNKEKAILIVDNTFSRTELRTDEPASYNAEVIRGDWRDYPEHLHKIAECLRDLWMFSLPSKPSKINKKDSSKYKMFILAMEQIKESCAEFGIEALIKTHGKWIDGFNGGIAPYTIAQPTSLINPVAGTVIEMRNGKVNAKVNTLTPQRKFETL